MPEISCPTRLARTALPQVRQKVFRPDQHLSRIAPFQAVYRTIAYDGTIGQNDVATRTGNRNHCRVQEVAFADEAGNEFVRRTSVELFRRIQLLDNAAVQHRDPVRHNQRFFLIVGDEDERDAKFVLQGLQLLLHLVAQVLVECRQRFIQQKNFWPRHKRTGKGHPAVAVHRKAGRSCACPFRQGRQAQACCRHAV